MINILCVSIILSIWCVTLFFGKNIGLSMLLYVAPLTGFIVYILKKNNRIKNKKATLILVPIILLSSTYFIYNNEFFYIINCLAIPILIIIMILKLFGERLELSPNIIGKVLEIPCEALSRIGEAIEKVKVEIEEKLNIRQHKKSKSKKVIKSVLIALPLIIIVLILLSTADSIFGHIFIKTTEKILVFIENIQITTEMIKLFFIVVSSIYLLAFFYFILNKFEADQDDKKINNKTKDDLTIKIILGLLNAIYLVFCIIQIKSLFMKMVDINYADYARQGFFQLMVVSIINIVTIVIAKGKEFQPSKFINIMSLMMVGFTFIILISSAYRMYLYERAYGYTLLRLLVYCSLLTESILLIPTVLHILDKEIDLFNTYFVIIISVYVCMNFANFDNIIAKRNVDRYLETGKIDLEYLEFNTGVDASKQLERLIENCQDDDINKQVKTYLEGMKNNLEEEKMDFRDFNISKLMFKTR